MRLSVLWLEMRHLPKVRPGGIRAGQTGCFRVRAKLPERVSRTTPANGSLGNPRDLTVICAATDGSPGQVSSAEFPSNW